MPSLIPRSRTNRILLTALLVVLLGSACGAQPSPVVQVETRLQTVEVTVEVTSQVTREVTRLVEVPVTISPSPTPDISQTPSLTPTITRTPTITHTPSLTPTPDPPVVTILVNASCKFGPGSAYLYKYGLPKTIWMEVIGRTPANPNTDPKNILLLVQAVHGTAPNPCWVKAEFVRFNDGGDITTHPEIPLVSYTFLPLSTLYRAPQGASAVREGTKVTIYWAAVWMTEDDYRGYLVEAWVCKDGQLTFTPLEWFPPLKDNVGLIGIYVIDEPGCLETSSARVYAVEKHGYTNFRVVPWPPFEPTPTVTTTPTYPDLTVTP